MRKRHTNGFVSRLGRIGTGLVMVSAKLMDGDVNAAQKKLDVLHRELGRVIVDLGKVEKKQVLR